MASLALPYNFSLSGAVGAQFVEDDVLEDYTTWNIGLSHKLLEVLTLDVRYHDSTLSGADCAAYSGAFDSCEERVVGSVRVDLPMSLFTAR